MSTLPPAGPAPAPGPATARRLTSAQLADRYGRAGRGRRLVGLGVVASIVLASAAWGTWAWLGAHNRGVSGMLLAYTVVNAATVKATLDVEKNPGVAARCEVDVYGQYQSVVGRGYAVLGLDQNIHGRYLVTIPTTERAIAAKLTGCTVTARG
ncbi:MAG: DUF4307 domain-containing protein [Actinomycetes bacterium]